MQDVNMIDMSSQASHLLDAPNIDRSIDLRIVVTKNNDPATQKASPYCFSIRHPLVIFESINPGMACQLVCQLVDADGKAFPSEELSFQNCHPTGPYFKKHMPTWNGQETSTLRVAFNFDAGNTCGALTFILSNGQTTPEVRIFNTPESVLGVAAGPRKMTLTVVRSESGHFSVTHHPATGINFHSVDADVVLICELVGKNGDPPPSGVYFKDYQYEGLDNIQVDPETPPSNSTRFNITFGFGGKYTGGALTFYCTNPTGGDHLKIDPQVINVPTTGGGPG